MKKVIITTKWIPVEEAMPPETEDVLVFYPNSKYGEIRIDCWFACDNGRFCLEDTYGKATHWMPLPKPPKGVQ